MSHTCEAAFADAANTILLMAGVTFIMETEILSYIDQRYSDDHGELRSSTLRVPFLFHSVVSLTWVSNIKQEHF